MKLIVATHNPGKLQEFRRILGVGGFEVEGLASDAPMPEEVGTSLEENALIKARGAFEIHRRAIVADDSGLFVDSLGGQPGVLSARYAGLGATDGENRSKLLSEMALVGSENRDAEFRCVLCVIDFERDSIPEFYNGVVKGRITDRPVGDAGFGYDPIFVPYGSDGRTFAQMSPDEKNAVSHRARALEVMLAAISKRSG